MSSIICAFALAQAIMQASTGDVARLLTTLGHTVEPRQSANLLTLTRSPHRFFGIVERDSSGNPNQIRFELLLLPNKGAQPERILDKGKYSPLSIQLREDKVVRVAHTVAIGGAVDPDTFRREVFATLGAFDKLLGDTASTWRTTPPWLHGTVAPNSVFTAVNEEDLEVMGKAWGCNQPKGWGSTGPVRLVAMRVRGKDIWLSLPSSPSLVHLQAGQRSEVVDLRPGMTLAEFKNRIQRFADAVR